MTNEQSGENSEELRSEWRQLVRHPVSTDPVVRRSSLDDERAVDLAQEQQAYRQRYLKRSDSAEPAGPADA